MDSLKFIFREQIQDVFNSFTRLLGIRIVFFTADGIEVKVGDNRDLCSYCKMLRNEFDCAGLCEKWDRDKQNEARLTSKMVSYRCYAGLTEATMPVVIEGDTVGFIMMGQFRTSDEFSVPAKLSRLPKSGIDKLRDEYYNVPLYSADKVREILRLFEILVDFILSHRLIMIKNQDPVEALLEYINNNPTEKISPRRAAAMVFRSTSSVSHLFKEATGMGIINYQIENKLRIFEKIITDNPQITIKEAAFKAGFDDSLYFSRLYRKKRKKSPTQFRDLCAGAYS